MKELKAYVIIIDADDNKTIIPKKWMAEDLKGYYWPLFDKSSDLKAAIIKQIEPKDDWDFHDIHQIVKSDDDYAKAVANSKMQGLEDLTDPSDTEKQMRTRSDRLRKRPENESEQQQPKRPRLSQTRIIHSSDDESNDTSTNTHTGKEEAIKVPKNLNINKNKDLSLKKSAQVAKSKDKLEVKKISSASGGTSSETNGQKKNCISPGSAISHLSDDEENGNKDEDTTGSKKTCISPRSAFQQLTNDDNEYANENKNDESTDHTLKTDYPPDLLKVIYDVCCKLLTKVNSLTAKVDRLESTVSKQKLLVANSSENRSITEEDTEELKKYFPMKKKEDVVEVEQKLKKSKEFYRNVVIFMNQKGGSDYRKLVYNMMKELMTNELATKFNYTGRGSSEGFKKLTLCNCIYQSVRRSFQANDDDIKDAIKSWLDQTNTRLERDRKKAQEKFTPVEIDI